MRAEVAACFERYESALRAHDLGLLNAFFVDRPDTVRFGIAEQQYGREAITRWRATCRPVHPMRELLRLVIATHGNDCASVSAELREPDLAGVVRQSQTWVRTATGWKILAAHVSVNAS